MVELRRRSNNPDVKQIESPPPAPKESDVDFSPNKGDTGKLLSTGSTLLDLAISGRRVSGGGVPGGILVEYYGPSGAGKTALLAELCGSAQKRGGKVRFADSEGRLDKEYSTIYGVNIQADVFDYHRPNTVEEMFELIGKWNPGRADVINLFAGDSMAALTTELELGATGDKMGMKRAKDISAGLRKICIKIANNNWVIALSNQVRTGQAGQHAIEVTPGGMGVPFYASLRIRVSYDKPAKIEKEKEVTVMGAKSKQSKVVGINSLCEVTKSSVDEPYRKAPIRIIFGYGLDDIGANLQYVKDVLGAGSYDCFDRTYVSLDLAIDYIEKHSYEKRLRERVVNIWEEIQCAFETGRKPKER